MKAKVRKEIPRMLKLAGNKKKVKGLQEKFEQTGTLSKRDLNVLWDLVADHADRVAA